MDTEMPQEPLVGVKSPLESLPKLETPTELMSVMFTFIFIIWLVYTIISVYHWFRFGRNSWIAVPAVTAHVVVSGALMLFITSGFK